MAFLNIIYSMMNFFLLVLVMSKTLFFRYFSILF
jgi:hypothetical protein